MNIQSVAQKDIRRPKSEPGAYEWWYFDAISDDGTTKLVIIFYEGNPFSRRYIQRRRNGAAARAEQFPAISISVYQNQQPIYYSFTELAQADAAFSDNSPAIRIGNHRVEPRMEHNTLTYDITLDETLPSGDAIDARLSFQSSMPADNKLDNTASKKLPHEWHIIQPIAEVNGQICCTTLNSGRDLIHFSGQGYHDHNAGLEPLKNKFEEWYWGRIHFDDYTLIYYLMGEGHAVNTGWLLDNSNLKVRQVLDEISVTDYSPSIFGLKTARKIELKNSRLRIMIQQSELLDNGPFYQRFSSDGFLTIPEESVAQTRRGITEYICPPRIHNRLFWPLVNMRIRYKKESPHWVQRSKTLYRWTW